MPLASYMRLGHSLALLLVSSLLSYIGVFASAQTSTQNHMHDRKAGVQKGWNSAFLFVSTWPVRRGSSKTGMAFTNRDKILCSTEPGYMCVIMDEIRDNCAQVMQHKYQRHVIIINRSHSLPRVHILETDVGGRRMVPETSMHVGKQIEMKRPRPQDHRPLHCRGHQKALLRLFCFNAEESCASQRESEESA